EADNESVLVGLRLEQRLHDWKKGNAPTPAFGANGETSLIGNGCRAELRGLKRSARADGRPQLVGRPPAPRHAGLHRSRITVPAEPS
ncbi:hypothetical protein, partial [Streptomyces sp. GSL17-113]|uniref:hypothetical protein n=1 Tax=Streptomyces sp. GSL17-113 TaxID=3115365 RepID=UPI002E75AE2E